MIFWREDINIAHFYERRESEDKLISRPKTRVFISPDQIRSVSWELSVSDNRPTARQTCGST